VDAEYPIADNHSSRAEPVPEAIQGLRFLMAGKLWPAATGYLRQNVRGEGITCYCRIWLAGVWRRPGSLANG
jgi:hypothetical protein